MRKISVIELLSNYRLAMLSHVRESSVKNSVKNSVKQVHGMLVKEGSCLVEMKRWFEDITTKVTLRIIAGNAKIEVDDGFRAALKAFFDLGGAFILADAIPFLRWFDFGGYEKEMKKTGKKMDDLLQMWLDEHKRRKFSGEAAGAEKGFMDVMLEILDDGTHEALNFFDADTINKATCLGFIVAGTDTTTRSLTWALALLLNNPHELKKAQEELETHVGGQRQVKESDMKNLVYIQAIIRETMRLHSPIQLLTMRENTEDCILHGYHVPAGTRLFVNLWMLHNDPQIWPDPGEFRPDRFLTTHKDVDLRGKHFDLIPFGSGKRGCAGVSFALQVMEFTLASLIHAFQITTPTGEPIDMTESSGFPTKKVRPLEVLLAPRRPREFYEGLVTDV
ncbi:hypothetical protein Vadar_026750 [Vaccinium darrowii]|uniref:Uncharacterized protein n=1 Tax=Vaccinium darrowii TaxID=229202 RepID=A0ACB7Y9K9_9ERIC|nr:hypothetical protein Vadar_026750 [Vaccinium darrowii]